MQTIFIPVSGGILEARRILSGIHERETMREFQRIGGGDLRSWMFGNELIVASDAGPNSARFTLRGDMFGARDISVQSAQDSESYFAIAVVKAAVDAMNRKNHLD